MVRSGQGYFTISTPTIKPKNEDYNGYSLFAL